MRNMIRHWYRQLDGIFSEQEAWTFFKIMAILETIGWTLLIIGIIFKYFELPLNDWVMALAGSTHGVIVLAYMIIVLFVHRSLGWSLKRFAVAELINAVPYGVLAFEMWASRERRHKQTIRSKPSFKT